ncbi:MAG: UDP-N-acetylmuramate dehydrogenase [Fidelibacterota bacterium]
MSTSESFSGKMSLPDVDKLESLETILRGSVMWNEPMSQHTSYGIGGPARAFIYPADEDDLASVLKIAHENTIPTYFIGSGSNLLVSDAGFDGWVISLARHFRKMRIKGTRVSAQSGTMMGHFVKECFKENLAGVESLIGVPGTLGGAIRMNAGAYGREISNFLKTVRVMTITGGRKEYGKDELDFGYRTSSLSNREVICSAEFEFEKGSPQNIQLLRNQASRSRKSTQPLRFRSAGSVFKNPSKDNTAGYLIDQAGLKGTRRGGAQISPKHANFFINHENASSQDIVWLIHLARRKVKEKFGIDLELEIKTLGFPPGHFDHWETAS